jgi:flagellar hook-associated protein 2
MGISGSIDGIMSGFDTTGIINTIIQYESRRIDLFAQKQTEHTNKLTTWGSIEAMLVSVKTQANLLTDENLWYAKSVTSSNEEQITVSSSTEAVPGTYLLTVNQLATNHQIASQGMGSLSENMGSGTIEIKVGNTSSTIITIDETNKTLSALKDAINNSAAKVTAAIINDGSENNPYRLVLTAKDSGAANQITFTANLSGGTAPSFSPGFDWTEKLSWSEGATANPYTTTDAEYTGSTNKIYTFTVGGTGLQTIGDGDIDIDWTDGTNSGTITVAEANADIALTGDGADGLSIYFSAGDLQAGDTFQVQAFAPTIQTGQDAIVQLGSSDNGGSPITFTHYENTISELIEGVTLELLSVSAGNRVEIKISEDRDQIKAQINQFVNKYNEFQDFVDSQFSYTEGSTEAGVLLGETSLITLYNDIRQTISSVLTGRPDDMKMLSQVGVKFGSDGKLSFDESAFNEKIEDNFTDVVNLFKSNGVSNSTYIEYISSSAQTKVSTAGYNVNITQAATKGIFAGTSITDPATANLTLDSTNNRIKLIINSASSTEIALTEKTYTSGEELAEEMEEAINNEGFGVEVEWIDLGTTGYLEIHSNTYGSSSTIELDIAPTNSAHDILGLTGGTSTEGLDVEGTINGEPASGIGQYLTGDDDNENTAGLKLLITLSQDQLGEGAEGVITFHKGIASIINEKISAYTDPHDGVIKGKKDALQSQIDTIADQIEGMNEQLERKRTSLYMQFTEMEKALAQLQTQQQYLTAAINNLNQLNQAISSGNYFS